MKTFTNRAEKKAKQILNLLQGYTKGIRITAILILLLMGVNNAWAGEATIYVTGHIFKDSWDASKSEVRIGYNYDSNDGKPGNENWTGHKSMTLTQHTYNGYPIYSYKVSSNTNWAQIFFYHYKDGNHHDNQQQDTGGWTEFTNNNNKVYVGWIDNGHRWVELCEENTFYFLKNDKAVNWTNVYAYAWSGSINNSWPGTLMTNTGKTYNGTPIYSVKLYCTYATIIFNQGNGTNQSGDQTTSGNEGKIFDYKNNKWLNYTYDVTVTFDANGHGTAPSAKTILKGNKVTAPTEPIASGYTFGGWYTDKNCTSAFDFNTAITDDKTLYAKWTANVITHTVTFGVHSSGNGTLTAKAGSTSINSGAKVNQGSSITFTANPSTGYEVAGWYSNPGGTSVIAGAGTSTTYTINSLAAAATVYVKFQGKKYTVTLSNQSATTAGTASVQATYGSAMPSATMPQKTGYTFGGYYTAINGGGTQYYNANGGSSKAWNIANNTTLYAKWTANQYTITYKDQGNVAFSGTHASGYPTKHTYGTATTLKDATKTGYTFDGWHTDAACTNKVTSLGATAYTANITLYAKWTATPTTIYLKPGLPWKKDNARFAIYAWGGNNGDKWVDMTAIGCNEEYYVADVPAGYSQFKFVRLNPETTENNFNDGTKWGETGNLSIPNDAKNLYDISKKLHLNRGSWNQNQEGRYAAYFFKENDNAFGNAWVDLISGNATDVYYCDIPSDKEYPNVIFCRMDPNQGNGWDNNKVWHQTNNLSLADGNYYTITSFGGNGSKAEGNWTYIYTGEWMTLELPTMTISNNNPTFGDVVVKTIGGTTITSGMEVDWDTQVIVSVQPKAGYAVKSSSINIGGNAETIQSGKTYTICNSTTISVSFEEKGEWYIAGIDGNWEVREEYKFIDDRILIELDGKETKEFKVVKKTGDNTEWYGNYTFKGLYPRGELNTNSGDNTNCKVETVHDGDYLFIWNADEKRLTIEYPDVIFLHGSFNGWKDKPSHALHNQDAKVYLTSNTTYEFKVAEKGVYWTSKAYETIITNNGTKNIDDNTAYDTDPRHNCQIKTTITGLYTFHFDKETRVLTVTYPEDNSLKAGDYRLYYTETSKNHASDYVKKRAIDGRDTVSLFINKDGSYPKVTLQQYNGSIWVDVNTEEVYNVSDINAIANDEHMYQGNGVWNFIITQVNGVAKVAINETHRYIGNYYIRTEVAGGGWNEYKIPENQMFFSSYARDNENFDHYFCKYINIDKSSNDVRFNVANDYCSQLCPNNFNNDNLVSGYMPASGNVRFMYFSKTNTLGRAYLDGSSTDNFLRITDATTLYDADGKNSITTAKFTDLQNWIYQVDVQATSSTQIKLRAIYNGNEQYFKGSANPNQTVPLLASTSNDKHKIRLIYNFKTNHLVCAWLAAGETIDGDNQTLGADMMLIRENQDPADQLYFNPNYNTLSEVKNAYAVMTFTEDFIKNEEKTIYERALYWVSFPYDVLISQVFGFGEYGEHWIMQYYDGAARAEKGLFSDSGTYWKYITDTRTILEKGKGYVLTLDLDKVKTSFIHGIESVSLYFPSDGELGIIQGDDPTAVDVPEHECKINFSNDPDGTNKDKRDRRIYDSHWNMIGVPRFADISDFDTDNDLAPVTYSADSLSFYYEYLPKTDKYQTRIVTADFQAMYGYMVQFAGTINWTEKEAIKPAQLAARRNADNTEPEKISFRLEIAQGEEMADQTFVQMQQEGATAEFDMNIDLTKIINSGANIYTLAGEQRIQSAGNALPMGEAIVPVGVQIAAEGEYTFRMPDGTEGMVVELVDYETNTRTNLLLSDYTVTLQKGSNENRFALHIQPQKDVVTSLENIGEGVNNGKAVNKYLIDGKLIIRTAEGIFDAQGHRL